MRYVLPLVAGLMAVLAFIVGPPAGVTYAAFHCMRIHAVKAGIAGNGNVQYLELRMDAPGQPLVLGHTIQFLDGSGTLKATFTFPADVTNSATGDSILIATSEFNAVASGGAADFTFSNANTVGANGGDPLHPIQSPNGKIVYAAGSPNCNLVAPVDSVAFGTATADYGTATGALPGASDARALRLNNLNAAPTNNSTEYSLQPVSSFSYDVAAANLGTDFRTPRNNARRVLELTVPSSVGGVAQVPGAAQDVASQAHATAPSGGAWRWPYAVVAALAVVTALSAGWLWRMRSHDGRR